MKHYNEYKYVLINENVMKTVNDIKKIIEYNELLISHNNMIKSRLKKS